MTEWWFALPAWAQDALVAAVLAAVPLLWGALLLRGYAPGPLIAAQMRRERGLTAAFVALVAVVVGVGAAITAQERGLRVGTAAAADGFDMIVAAPGSETEAMLSTVFLQPRAMDLLGVETFETLRDHPRVTLAAPLAFGDSWQGHPVVGTTAALIDALAGPPAEGRPWATQAEALAGADVPLAVGDVFTPAHGHGDAATDDHADEIAVVGRLARTGTPWDGAVLVPAELVWAMHARPAPLDPTVLGPPYAADTFGGTPAIVVRADGLASAYALRGAFSQGDTMAFFPAEVLANLYRIMGDVRQAFSLIGTATQLLVAGAVLLAPAILARLGRRRTAMLHALGAPTRFAVAVAWGHATAILAAGTALGLALGLGAAAVVSALVSERTGLAVPARVGWPEVHAALAFLALASSVAVIPAWRGARAPGMADLRG